MKDSIKTLRTMERKDKIKKIGATIATGAMTAMPFMVNAFAADTKIKSIVGTFLAYAVDIFVCVGVLLAVWAVGQLTLAFKNEDADSKSKAMMLLVVAAVLIGIKFLANQVAGLAGFSLGTGFLMTGMYTPLL